jgi:pimeloyl-ACP methyl ester carboxylesterase
VAVYEPVVLSVAGPDDLARTGATMENVGMAATDGRLVDAMRVFAPWVCNDEEVAALEQTDFYQLWSTRVPAMLRFIQGDASYHGPRATDPEALARITAPVLVLQGQQTRLRTWFTSAAQYITNHVASSQFYELPGLGHFAPVLQPASIADELVTFFESTRQPA